MSFEFANSGLNIAQNSILANFLYVVSSLLHGLSKNAVVGVCAKALLCILSPLSCFVHTTPHLRVCAPTLWFERRGRHGSNHAGSDAADCWPVGDSQ